MSSAQSIQTQAALRNKFGVLAYGLFVIASFLPIASVEFFGMNNIVYGIDVIPVWAIVMMALGAFLCGIGAPKLFAKGIAVFAICYFYYECFRTYQDLSQMLSINDMQNLFSNRSYRRDMGNIISQALNMLSIGFWLITASFFMMKAFIFTPYSERYSLAEQPATSNAN
ncbi:hypothetical protein [Vibrio hippocampi]|uniref:Uncharacterized protein n=1 Tax=Vibrio hippocampi TaxID=654686 RepID=A0ABM8ZMC5_9VIBR|nr:hypothetical protein [Vibrio hippocampi]CAH0529696.1 hypothetical protein VHP8226_03451 [Vibrio hippocampi]